MLYLFTLGPSLWNAKWLWPSCDEWERWIKMEPFMERGLKVHLPFLLAQGIEDAQYLASKQRTVSCCYSCYRDLYSSSWKVALVLCATFTPKWLFKQGMCVHMKSAYIIKISYWEHVGVCLSHTYLVYVSSDMCVLYSVTVYIWYTFYLHLVTI